MRSGGPTGRPCLWHSLLRQWRALFRFNGSTFASGLHYSKTEPWTSIAFRLPDNQRPSMALRIKVPRDMHNHPSELKHEEKASDDEKASPTVRHSTSYIGCVSSLLTAPSTWIPI